MTQDSGRTPPFLIHKVWAKNFRSIGESSMELSPLTALVGPNASGKSNAVDILRFIRDSLRFDLETAISLRHGFDIIKRQPWEGDNPPTGLEVGLEAQKYHHTLYYSFTIVADERQVYRVAREIFRIRHLNETPLDIIITDGRPDSSTLSLYYDLSYDEEQVDFGGDNFVLSSLLRALHFDRRDRERKRKSSMQRSLQEFHRSLRNMHCYDIYANVIKEPQRPENRYPLAENGRNLASVLRHIEMQHPDRMALLKEALHHLIPRISDLQIVPTGGYLVVQVKRDHPLEEDRFAWFDLSQESDGTLGVVAMLTALYQKPSPSLIGVEEPEHAIYPRKLAAFAEVLGEVALTTQVLITSHSPDLLDHLPVASLRVVDAAKGTTTFGNVSHHQLEAVKRNLFSAGELHRMEGLQQEFNSEG